MRRAEQRNRESARQPEKGRKSDSEKSDAEWKQQAISERRSEHKALQNLWSAPLVTIP